MEPFWKGAFGVPQPVQHPVEKHRDYQHSTFAEHVADHQGRRRNVRYVNCDTNPVTEEYFIDGPKVYIEVEVNLGEHHPEGKKNYLYLVPFGVPKEYEWEEAVRQREATRQAINDYADNPPLFPPRNHRDYIDEVESLPTRLNREKLPPLDTSWQPL